MSERSGKSGWAGWAGAGLLLLGGSAFAALSLPSYLTLNQLDTTYIGETAGGQAGISIAAISDLNGDPWPDLVVGAPYTPADTKTGKVYIFFGKTSVPSSTWKTDVSLGSADVVLTGEKNSDNAGATVASIGDIDKDGFKDIAIAAPFNTDGGTSAGKVYVVFGRSSGWPKTASLGTFAEASFIGYTQERVGYQMIRAGNVNGGTESIDDFLVGNFNHNETGKAGAGRTYLIFGKKGRTSWTKNIKLTDSLGKTAYDASIVGDIADHRVGLSSAGLLDVNQDGLADIAIGASGDTSDGQQDRGQVGIIYGRSSGWAKDMPFTATCNVIIKGEQDGGEFGKSLNVVNSLDGDLYRDLIVSAPYYDTDSSNLEVGKVYMFKGRGGNLTWASGSRPDASSADAAWTGEAPFDRAGGVITEAEDFNQDGLADMLITSEFADYKTSSDNTGRVYLITGRLGMSGTTSLKYADMIFQGVFDTGRAGVGLAGGLDVDGDYFPDIAIGAPKSDPSTGNDAGTVYIVRGSRFADQDEDGYSPFYGDCDDYDNERSPAIAEVPYDSIDQDCSGADLVDVDKDGYSSTLVNGTDCNDSDASIKPGATEVCNNKDDNCNNSIDEGALITFYADKDGDGYGTPDSSSVTYACTQPAGTAQNFADCNDTCSSSSCPGASIYPGAAEVPYDGIDQDCQGGDLVDVDGDGDASVQVGGPDCDDGDSSISSHGIEQPYDSIDQDCDGQDLVDVDEDGFDWAGLPGGTDCDDSDPGVHPGATDVAYNFIDEDCLGGDLVDVDGDGYDSYVVGGPDCNDDNAEMKPGALDVPNNEIDENCDGALAADADLDGFSVPDDEDCDDEDPLTYPGADEIPYDGLDQDCDGEDIVDVDQDGYVAVQAGGDDCNDRDALSYPGATDPPYDGIDQDCDGVQVNDVDGDGFNGIPAGGGDCNDQDPDINPGADEIPGNAIDENCNDTIGDQDGDGFGTGEDTFGEPADCDDNDSSTYPGAEDVPYDGVDQDCSGTPLWDVDGDSFDGGELGTDCDDENPDINPAAEEIENGIDDNCDNIIDETDRDQDSFTLEDGDCNDLDASVYPGAVEITGDEKDNDCDGRIDERVLLGEQEPGGLSCSVWRGGEGGGRSVPLGAIGLMGLLVAGVMRGWRRGSRQ